MQRRMVLYTRHKIVDIGYEMAAFTASDYPMYSASERVWVKLAAIRDAMELYPQSEWFWYLDQVSPPRSPDLTSRMRL